MPQPEPILIGAVLLLAGVVAGKVSGRLGIPALILFLGIGMLAGSDGPGGIDFNDADMASAIGSVALAFILFSGGLDTRWSAVRPVLRPGIVLATFGTALTAALTGAAAIFIFDVSPALGLLIGSIVSSTDAAAVFSVLRSRGINLRGRLRPLLEFESASNDPMAVFLTVCFTTLVLTPESTVWQLIWLFIQQVLVGAALGILLGRASVWVVNRIRLEYEGLYPVLTLALVLFIYSLTAALGGSGFLAVYLAGITMARHRLLHKRTLMRFHDGVSWLMQITMFLLLGLLVFPSRMLPVTGRGLLLAGVLMFIARPVAVWVSLAGKTWPRAERLLISWVGLRGAVPIILATFPLAAGVERAGLIFNAVFFVVILSVALQGTTIPIVARWLKVDAPGIDPADEREEIVGGESTGRTLHEIEIEDDWWAVGRRIVELDLPPSVWLVLITREGEFLVPQGPTEIEPGDRLTVLANAQERKQVERILTGMSRLR
ncbi:MAG TPA: potassium/proton antiporter [Acidimicrobiia bacterium]|jgi:cell volume regulation protein A|nr:potassium/proton antiporter [Acidimicrobiia bacterium]